MGVTPGVLFNSNTFPRAEIDAQLAALARTGATTVRSDALWETAEPTPPSDGVQLFPPAVGLIHHYDWRRDDQIAGMLAAHGLRWLPIIDSTATSDESVPVATHPYGPTPEHVLDSVRSDRLAMNADGMSTVPLYVTEFGWTTHPQGAHDWAAPEKRPGYIWQTLAGLGHTDCGIAAVLLYAW